MRMLANLDWLYLQAIQTCDIPATDSVVLAMVWKKCSCCPTSCAVTKIRSAFPSINW